MKKWIDANEITMIHELPTREFIRQMYKKMREKPQFDKNKDVKNKKSNYKK